MLLVLVAGLLAAGCGGERAARSVVLITVDTLRADALGAYGAASATTPAIDRLAAEGVLFESAVAPMPVTLPSHFSLFTGRYPREHGVVNNQLSLPAEARTLAEELQAAGLRTAGFPGVRFFRSRSGAAQGFETFTPTKELEDRAGTVVDRALAWLAQVGPEERFFLWVHVYDPHMPYAPPPEWAPPQEPPGASGIGDRVNGQVLKALARRHGGAVEAAALDRTRALYQGEVDAVDAALGRLLAGLEARAHGEETVIALTADHGECFDHGYAFRHEDCLYQGAVRVPLILHGPGAEAGRRVSETVETVHLAATLLHAAGLRPPESFRDGDLLRSPPAAGAPAFFQPILSDERAASGRDRAWAGIDSVAGVPLRPALRSRVEPVGVRAGRWTYLLGGALGEELYDLEADPDESRNLTEDERRKARELRAEARRFGREVPFTVLEEGALPPEVLEQLKALGYL
jgi:arylsulfatase A-like enzyme